MHDVPRWVLCAALGFAGFAARPASAAQYSAHPELQQEAVVGQQAAFLARSAQRAIALRYRDTRDPRILERVRAAMSASEARAAAWLDFMAGPTPAPVQWQPPATAIAQTHRWTKILAQVSERRAVEIPLHPEWARRAESVCVLGCRAFVADLLKVVHPHADPMRPGHLEAFNPALAEDPERLKDLAALRGVRALNPNVGPVAAVREVLPGRSSLEILRLLALASHNHALEVRLLEHVVTNTATEAEAVRVGLQALADLDHLYQLLAAFYGPGFDKPYHFHGAALVACELIERGYPRPLVAWTGVLLGEAYERASAHPDADDVRLHEAGTRYGIAACTGDRS